MVVVKVGGSAGIDYDALCDDLAAQWQAGQRVVLVHGGSDETNRLAEALNYPPEFVTSPSGFTSRFTDRETLEIFVMAASKLNTTLVERLQRRGINALGLSGVDGQLLSGRRKEAIRIVEDGRERIRRGDWTGTIDWVNAGLLALLLDNGYLPVVAPLACSAKGEALNVDGDRAAAAIAAALNADTLLLLSNVPGLLRDFPDEASLIAHIPRDEIDAYMPFAQGRMKKKVLGASEALTQGVGRVVLADARAAQPITRALDGAGTTLA